MKKTKFILSLYSFIFIFVLLNLTFYNVNQVAAASDINSDDADDVTRYNYNTGDSDEGDYYDGLDIKEAGYSGQVITIEFYSNFHNTENTSAYL